MKNLAIIFVLLLFFSSCKFFSGRTDDVIAEKKLVDILVEVHLIDGLYSIPEVSDEYKVDNLPYYYDEVFEKHGCTRAQLDSSIRYYSGVQGKLEDIYEKVIFELKKYEDINLTSEDIDARIAGVRADNLWKKKQFWKLPEESEREALLFEIPLRGIGRYIVNAKIKVYEDDESSKPSITAFLMKKTDESENHFERKIEYFKKDGIEHEYTLEFEFRKQDANYLKGWILDHRSKEGEWKKHVEVSKIKISYIPFNDETKAGSKKN